MMNINEQSISVRLPIMDWQTESLRLTAFPSPAAQVAETTWWTDLLGMPPETRTTQPRMGKQREVGTFEEGKLVLEVQPYRIDWLFTITEGKEPSAEGIITIGKFPETLEKFLDLMIRWFKLETCPSVQRLAFGAVLLLPVKNIQEGYRQLSAYLPHVQLDSEGSSDFFYQINRLRNSRSGIAGLRINRLSKWSVASMMGGVFLLGPAPVAHFIEPEHFACRLELDINTAADFKDELTREQLSLIFQELVDLGKEIVQEGDIL